MEHRNEQSTIPRLTAILMRLAALGGTALLVLLFAAVLARSFAQFILVDAIGLSEEHPLVSVLLKERQKNAEDDDETVPLSENALVQTVQHYTAAVRKTESEIERAMGDYTLGRNFFTRLVNRTEHTLGYDLNAFEDESILLLDDYCYTLEAALTDAELDRQTEAECGFADAVAARGIPFLHVELPNKVCIEQDWTSGTFDHAEQNRLHRVARLRDSGIDVLDLTDELHADGLSHRELFFPTDHHWTPAAALWAADVIAAYAEQAHDICFDRSVLREDQYTVEVYEDVFLGSAGKKVTTEKIAPDDFSLYYPKYETDIDLYLQRSYTEEPRIDTRGDFALQYDMYYLEIFTPILESDIYSTYLYANPCKIRITNHKNPSGPRILLIGDSYDNVLIPFLAQAAGETIALDCRFASVQELHGEILSENIDLVITTTHALERLLPQ